MDENLCFVQSGTFAPVIEGTVTNGYRTTFDDVRLATVDARWTVYHVTEDRHRAPHTPYANGD